MPEFEEDILYQIFSQIFATGERRNIEEQFAAVLLIQLPERCFITPGNLKKQFCFCI